MQRNTSYKGLRFRNSKMIHLKQEDLVLLRNCATRNIYFWYGCESSCWQGFAFTLLEHRFRCHKLWKSDYVTLFHVHNVFLKWPLLAPWGTSLKKGTFIFQTETWSICFHHIYFDSVQMYFPVWRRVLYKLLRGSFSACIWFSCSTENVRYCVVDVNTYFVKRHKILVLRIRLVNGLGLEYD